MTTYQDVVNANFPLEAWALPEASGTSFAPYSGSGALTGAGVDAYQQAGPFALGFSIHVTSGGLEKLFTLINSSYWCMEAWFNTPAAHATLDRTLMELGNNLAAGGAELFLAHATNELKVIGNGALSSTGFIMPVGSWKLIQWGNLTGNNGDIVIAVDGAIIFSRRNAADFTGINGLGWGRDPSNTSPMTGSLAWPAVYTSQQTAQNWYSRFLASTDPDGALPFTPSGGAVNNALLNEILAAVKRLFHNAP